MVNINNINTKKVGFFRFKRLNNKYLLTNDVGNYIFLEREDFTRFVEGKIKKKENIYDELRDKGFIKDDMNLSEISRKFLSKNAFLKTGVGLHIVVATLRCNFNCIYCQTSSQNIKRKDLDMDIEVAKRVVDFAFLSPNNTITIEFQGGEPLLNWDVVKFIIEYAHEKRKIENKGLIISVVTNLSLLDNEKLKFLIDKKVSLCTSIDGPEFLHNKHRGNNYKIVIKKFKKVMKEYTQKFDKYKPSALVTLTKYSLPYYKEIIDEYVKLGLEGIHLRYVNKLGCAINKYKEIGISSKDYLTFYKKSLEYILELNKKGILFYERFAFIFLIKILTDDDPNYMDIRSPCGAGIGCLGYNYNGDVYTCDEGRMLSMMGDENFKIGNVKENNYKEIIESEIVKTMCISSCLDGLPGCSDCVYKPYCGVCPVLNYVEAGNIFTQLPNNERCKINKGILDYIFKKLENKEYIEIFEKWIRREPQT